MGVIRHKYLRRGAVLHLRELLELRLDSVDGLAVTAGSDVAGSIAVVAVAVIVDAVDAAGFAESAAKAAAAATASLAEMTLVASFVARVAAASDDYGVDVSTGSAAAADLDVAQDLSANLEAVRG